jgi:predicted kinase
VLVVFGGLPGVGKTTIARELARRLRAVHVRIDSIEHAVRQAGVLKGSMEGAGYDAAYAVAEDNLRLGLTVVADSVNPLPITRDAWRDVGRRTGVRVFEVEVTCGDPAEHRRRVESRGTDFPGWTMTWQEVVDRDYRSWEGDRLVVDTAAATVDESVGVVQNAIETLRR